jgi:hypothetical protein
MASAFIRIVILIIPRKPPPQITKGYAS